jgi:hypothetical protein
MKTSPKSASTSLEPLVASVEVWAKQVDRSKLDGLTARSLKMACPLFKSPAVFAATIPPDVTAPEARLLGRERRFAGDATLPWARYWTLCHDSTGSDDGTLVAELSAYMDDSDRRDGIRVRLEEVDLSEPKAAQAYRLVRREIPRHRRALALHFSRSRDEAETIWVPLTVSRRRWQRAVDLRAPGVCDAFARAVSTMKMTVRGLGEYAVFKRKPVKRFSQILPTLLHQDAGGDICCKMIGQWLRAAGVEALIYPSARTDCSLRVERGAIVGWDGWNVVDYRRSRRRWVDQGRDNAPDWDTSVCEGAGVVLRARPNVRTPVEAIRLVHSLRGARKGSWQAEGIAAHQVTRARRRAARLLA